MQKEKYAETILQNTNIICEDFDDAEAKIILVKGIQTSEGFEIKAYLLQVNRCISERFYGGNKPVSQEDRRGAPCILQRYDSDGKPCSGVRGSHEVSTANFSE